MNDVDRAFYDLTVAQRSAAWHRRGYDEGIAVANSDWP